MRDTNNPDAFEASLREYEKVKHRFDECDKVGHDIQPGTSVMWSETEFAPCPHGTYPLERCETCKPAPATGRELYLYGRRAHIGNAVTIYEVTVTGHNWPQTMDVIEKSAYQKLHDDWTEQFIAGNRLRAALAELEALVEVESASGK